MSELETFIPDNNEDFSIPMINKNNHYNKSRSFFSKRDIPQWIILVFVLLTFAFQIVWTFYIVKFYHSHFLQEGEEFISEGRRIFKLIKHFIGPLTHQNMKLMVGAFMAAMNNTTT